MKSVSIGRKTAPGLFLALAVVMAAPSDMGRALAPVVLPPADLAGYAVPPKDAHPKIDSALWNLIQARTAVPAAAGEPVRIVLETDPDFSPISLKRGWSPVFLRIEALGGTIECAAGGLIQAVVPASRIALLSQGADISRLRLPLTPRTAEVVSEGVALSGASEWLALPPYRTESTPIRIAVLDLGFEGSEALIGTELPDGTTHRSFRTDGDLAAGTAHGTACAEIIHDMAPEAELILINFETDVEFRAAVYYLLSQDPDIISCSLVWTGAGAGDGTGPICQAVIDAAEADILWVNAAGDDGQSHWRGTFSDANGDSFHNFAGSDEILQWEVPAGGSTRATLVWNDWGTWNGSSYGAPTRDYDLLLWRWNGSVWELLEYCDDWQTGLAGQKPLEQSSLWTAAETTIYGVSILKYQADDNRTFDLTVVGNTGNIEYAAAAGSLAVPADAEDAIAVGAIVAGSNVLLAQSSQGPTIDGRIKPDFVAFSGVKTRSYGSGGFSGTSAAAPHVAGALGLLKSKMPYSIAQLRTILEKRALDLGPAGKDNLYGFGRLNLKK